MILFCTSNTVINIPITISLITKLLKYPNASSFSDDVLAIAFMTFFNSKKPILFPDITYSFYDVWAALFNIPFERPALDDDFNLVAADYYKENGGVVTDFLSGHPEFVKEDFELPGIGSCSGDATLWPQRTRTDGFYICRMRRRA